VKALIGCEFSGRVRDAFRARDHEAWSCDLLPSEGERDYHLQEDIRRVLQHPRARSLDLMIAHPECRYLALSGVRWLYRGGRKENGKDPERWARMREAAEFFVELLRADIPRLCLENSEMHPYALEIIGRGPDQEIQPWMFGCPRTKAAWLWLKNLPPLEPTMIVPKELRRADCHREPPGPNRWKNRSRTEPEVAAVMADQWGSLGGMQVAA